ncbi:Uncharacterized protein Adt_46877 [Abeliophyllum distichum]|uniref:Uncharacterized protein n=1 Tax=Abeliophyllum distichum TaxID=126358 RepID=A0ABD1NXB8_9LAMI
MSHRKVHSQGCVPFSWEEKPGLPKFTHLQKSSTDNFKVDPVQGVKIIPVPSPPSGASQPPRRSHSIKGMRWQDDPFLAALKACTKGVSRNHSRYPGGKEGQIKGNGNNSSKSVFSCKQSCDVESNNFVRFSNLPPLPRERCKAKPFVKNSQ